MRSLKFSFILLLLFLAAIFSLDRFGWLPPYLGKGIHPFVFGLTICAVVVMFLIPQIQRFSVFLFLFGWTVVYFVLRLLFDQSGQIFGGAATFITLVELGIIFAAILLSYQCGKQLYKFASFIDEVYLPVHERRIRKAKTAKEEINTEFVRSRRHQHPLSLLAISPDTKAKETDIKVAVEEIQRHMIGRFVNAGVAKIISMEARRTDMIISQDENEGLFFVLCPETKGEDTVILAERIRTSAMDRLGVDVNYGIASFPDEALTYDELVKRAEQHLTFNEKNPHAITTQSVSAESEGDDLSAQVKL